MAPQASWHSMRITSIVAVAIMAIGLALFLWSWQVEANFWANGGCGPLASCAPSGPAIFRFIGLMVIGSGAVVWAIGRRIGRRPAASP